MDFLILHRTFSYTSSFSIRSTGEIYSVQMSMKWSLTLGRYFLFYLICIDELFQLFKIMNIKIFKPAFKITGNIKERVSPCFIYVFLVLDVRIYLQWTWTVGVTFPLAFYILEIPQALGRWEQLCQMAGC